MDSHTQNNRADWSNYWQGRAAASGGQALVGVGVEHSEALAAFWIRHFEPLLKTTALIDMACGAGSVLRHANALGFSDLTGVDISDEAIAVLSETLPKAKGLVSAADAVSLPEACADCVVSQFGFEYAGDFPAIERAAHEMTRLLKPGGSFIAIVHMSGGAIEAESVESLGNIGRILGSGFIENAKAMFTTGYALNADPNVQNEAEFKAALMAMQQSEAQIIAWLQSADAKGNDFAGFAHYLITSSREMFDRRAQVSLEAALSWLDQMGLEIEAYRGRMLSMIRAALTPEQAEAILDIFGGAGYAPRPAEPFHFGSSSKPAAWALHAG